MISIIFSATLLAVVSAQYSADDAGSAPAPPPVYVPEYPPAPKPYPYPTEDDEPEFRKLKSLRIEGVKEANRKYFKKGDDNYVVISCPLNTTPNLYTWIVADSRDTIPDFNSVTGTVVLAGGVNVEYVAKLGRHGKWEGEDVFLGDNQKFRRVGCFFGTADSELSF